MRRIVPASLALLLVMFLAFTSLAQAGNKQLMSQKMAENDLKRNLVEAVIGYKVKGESQTGLTEDASYDVKTKSAAIIRGIKIDKMVYDSKKDVAVCFGHVDLGDVKNILGDRASFKNVRVEGFGTGTMTETSRPALRALRAAMLDAYNQMAAALVGEKVISESQAENFILTKDSNRSKVCAAIFGANIPHPDVNDPNRGWGWEDSGNAFVILQMDPHKVKDMLGNMFVYKGGDNIVSVTGHGAQQDELNTSGPDSRNVSPAGSSGVKTQYQDLDIPTSKPAAPERDVPGKSSL